MDDQLFHYGAHITDVYDGDTCTADIDLGLHTWVHGEKLRLYGINAPEVRGEERPEGILSRDFLRGLILHQDVLLEPILDKKGKYGRYLARIWLKQGDQWLDVNAHLVEQGFAEYHDY